jgi:hypothetical protein
MAADTNASAVDRRKLKHDFANDIYSLKINLEALQMLRDNPEEFSTLLALMRDTLQTFQQRIETTIALIPDDKPAT